jgi:hypothetical protein
MRKFILFFSLLIIYPKFVLAATPVECDKPDAPEDVRIYFANGVGNELEEARISRDALTVALGMQGNDFGLAYNPNEFWLIQLLQLYQQRKNESDEFWYWLRHLDGAPQWFHDDYASKAGRFLNQTVQGDPALQEHIRQYLADLNAGKKVVIVAHSQGNFYANNAIRNFHLSYPQYLNSIGVVSVANPANSVQDGGPYTTNPDDFVINLVRYAYPDTLVGNVSSSDITWTNHEFIEAYLGAYKSRIVGHVRQRISDLETPDKAFECKDPDEVPVSVVTMSAYPQEKTATLQGKVESGKMIAGHFIYNKAEDGTPATCWNYRNRIATSGRLNTGDRFAFTADKLRPGTEYLYRACGRQGERISDGGVVGFTTKGTRIWCVIRF